MFSPIELRTRHLIAKRTNIRVGIGIMVMRTGSHWVAFVGNQVLEGRNAMELVRKSVV